MQPFFWINFQFSIHFTINILHIWGFHFCNWPTTNSCLSTTNLLNPLTEYTLSNLFNVRLTANVWKEMKEGGGKKNSFKNTNYP